MERKGGKEKNLGCDEILHVSIMTAFQCLKLNLYTSKFFPQESVQDVRIKIIWSQLRN